MSKKDSDKSSRLNLQPARKQDSDHTSIDKEELSRLILDLNSLVNKQSHDLNVSSERFDERLKSLNAIRDFINRKTFTQENKEDTITFFLITSKDLNRELTPRYLSTSVAPFLNAINDLQAIINKLLNLGSREIQIRAIKHNSPLSVSLDGASEAIQVLQETISPWRRRHAEKMAQLIEQEKLVEIENGKASVLSKRAEAAKGRAESEKLRVETDKSKQEIERLRLENKKLRFEVEKARIQLALDILTVIAPNISEIEKKSYITKLLQPLDVVVSSDLEIITPET